MTQMTVNTHQLLSLLYLKPKEKEETLHEVADGSAATLRFPICSRPIGCLTLFAYMIVP